MLGACSFQKEPNKPAKVVETPKEVKVGMTKEEMHEQLASPELGALPDRIILAMKQEDDVYLALKIVSDAGDSTIDELGVEGISALDLALRYGSEELAVLLLQKGASPYLMRRGSTTRVLDAHARAIANDPNIKALVNESGRKLYETGVFYAKESIGELMQFALEKGFPLSTKQFGPSLLEVFAENIGVSKLSKDTFESDPEDCSYGVQEILQFALRLEGEASIPWSTFFGAALRLQSVELGKFTGKYAQISNAEYVKFLDRADSMDYAQIMHVQSTFGPDVISDQKVESSLIRFIERARQQDLIDLIYDKTKSKEIYERFPEAYRTLYAKVGKLEVVVVPDNHAGDGEGDLPPGKIESPRDLLGLYLEGRRTVTARCNWM